MLNDQIAHCNRAYNFIGRSRSILQVARAPTLIEHFGDSTLDIICRLPHIETVAQHHANRHDLSQGVRDTLARDIRSATVARFVQSHAVAQGSACKHTQRAGDLGCLV